MLRPLDRRDFAWMDNNKDSDAQGGRNRGGLYEWSGESKVKYFGCSITELVNTRRQKEGSITWQLSLMLDE